MRPSLILAAGLCLAGSASAQITLGGAAPYTFLTTPGNSTLNVANAHIVGQVGIGSGGHISLAGPSVISGDVRLRNTIATQFTLNAGTITGTVSENQSSLDSAIADAIAASNAAALLPATKIFGNITSTTTITGNGGVNIVEIGNINLNNASLLFHGTASDIFIVNVLGTMTLSGNGFVSASAGTWDTHVLLNFPGSGTITATGDPTVNATILAPHHNANLSGTFGSLFAGNGGTVTLSGGAKLHATPFVPAPGSISLLIGAGLLGFRRRR